MKEIVIALIAGGAVGALNTLVQFLITRHDTRKDKAEERDKALNDRLDKRDKAIDDRLDKIEADLKEREETSAKRYALLQKANGALTNRIEESKATTWRNHILRFAEEIANKQEHSREYWEQMLETCDNYIKFCDNHKTYVNSKAGDSIRLIKETHYKLFEEGRLSNE